MCVHQLMLAGREGNVKDGNVTLKVRVLFGIIVILR
jgi:hypothetical protein